MQWFAQFFARRRRIIAAVGASCMLTTAGQAFANPSLTVDVDTGQVLQQDQATAAWYPASLTKLMTTYVALKAVRQGRLTIDTPLVMSAYAARMPASKMGFRPGTQVTLDNALKMLMVKSPNDVAVMIAEGISGSVENFADDMNASARELGLHESHFVNPNGLHDSRHYSSARDMAMIGRALLRDFPDRADLYSIGALKLGRIIMRNHNGLIGRYPGADGMKTGFTCPAGFNVVASASQSGRRLIVVVLGEPSAKERSIHAAALFDRGFRQWGGAQGTLEALSSSGDAAPPDERQEICRHRSPAAIAELEDENYAAPIPVMSGRGMASVSVVHSVGMSTGERAAAMTAPVEFDPIPVFIGPKPGYSGPILAARSANRPQKEAGDAAAAYAPSREADPKAVVGVGDAPLVLNAVVKPSKAGNGKQKPLVATKDKPKRGPKKTEEKTTN